MHRESYGLRSEAEILCPVGKYGALPYWEVLDSAEAHAKQLLKDIKTLGIGPTTGPRM